MINLSGEFAPLSPERFYASGEIGNSVKDDTHLRCAFFPSLSISHFSLSLSSEKATPGQAPSRFSQLTVLPCVSGHHGGEEAEVLMHDDGAASRP